MSTHWLDFTDHLHISQLSAGVLKIFGDRVPDYVLQSLKKIFTTNHTSSHITHAERRVRALTPKVRRKLGSSLIYLFISFMLFDNLLAKASDKNTQP